MKLVIGLGNPGSEYEKTRHNIGWRILDAIAQQSQQSFLDKPKHNASVLRLEHGQDVDMMLVKPLTFMNRSGEAVQSLASYYKVPLEDVIVVYDDKDIPFGTIRLRGQGSSGGHNGVKSLIQHLGSDDFFRIRIGVGDSESPIQDTADFVLARFTPAEEEVLPDIIDAAVKSVHTALTNSDRQPHGDIVISRDS